MFGYLMRLWYVLESSFELFLVYVNSGPCPHEKLEVGMPFIERLKNELEQRKAAGNYRELPLVSFHEDNIVLDSVPYVDLASNDYLCIARDPQFLKAFINTMMDTSSTGSEFADNFLSSSMSAGSTGSRLLTGNHHTYAYCEDLLASLFNGSLAGSYYQKKHKKSRSSNKMHRSSSTVTSRNLNRDLSSLDEHHNSIFSSLQSGKLGPIHEGAFELSQGSVRITDKAVHANGLTNTAALEHEGSAVVARNPNLNHPVFSNGMVQAIPSVAKADFNCGPAGCIATKGSALSRAGDAASGTEGAGAAISSNSCGSVRVNTCLSGTTGSALVSGSQISGNESADLFSKAQLSTEEEVQKVINEACGKSSEQDIAVAAAAASGAATVTINAVKAYSKAHAQNAATPDTINLASDYSESDSFHVGLSGAALSYPKMMAKVSNLSTNNALTRAQLAHSSHDSFNDDGEDSERDIVTGMNGHDLGPDPNAPQSVDELDCLYINSGFDANAGVISTLFNEHDLLLVDKLCHASIIDGMLKSNAKAIRYAHNDMEHLEHLLEMNHNKYENVVIITESVFSMDGDCAKLREIVALKERYDNILIYVDEAHSFGLFGEDGLGLCKELKLLDKVDFIMGTLSKAIGSQGAFLICRKEVKEYLVNFMRPLIFATALPPFNVTFSMYVIGLLKTDALQYKRKYLSKISSYLHSNLAEIGIAPSESQIQPLITGDSDKALLASRLFRRYGLLALPIRYPTVPQNQARLRIALNCNLHIDDIDLITRIVKRYRGLFQ